MNDSFFNNEQIDVHSLPAVEDLEFIPIEKSYAKVLYISYSIFFLILFGIVFVLVLFQLGMMYWLSWALLLLILFSYFFFLWFAHESVRQKCYALREKDISFKSGVFFKDWITIPFNRVQHCEISKGVVDNMFGLTELKIFTAGGASSDIQIPGLKPDIAHQLKELIINKIKLAGDDEEE